MKEILRELADRLESNEFDVWNRAFSDVALLLERHVLARYGDQSYREAFSDESLVDISLDRTDVEAFRACLVKILRTNDDRSSTAAWALGKTYDEEISNELSEALEVHIAANNDEVVYQLIIALENCDEEKASSFMTRLSKCQHLPKAAEYAEQVLRLRS